MKLKKEIKRFFTLKHKANNGFTLVELIVVIAILGVLGGVAVPVYSGYVEKANKAADEELLAALNKAYTVACVENGDYNMKSLSIDPETVGDIKTQVVMKHYDASFQKYYKNGGVFKFYDKLEFEDAEGIFKGVSLGDVAKALKKAWGDSSFKNGGGTVVKTLLSAFDGIGGYFTLAAGGMDIEAWLLNNVSDELADALGLNGMLEGYMNATNLSDEEMEAYLLANVDEYATMSDDEKSDLKKKMKGNAGVLHFATDAENRSVADVKSSMDNFFEIMLSANNSVSDEYLAEYYRSTLDDGRKAWFDALSNNEKLIEINNFRNDPTAINLGDLKLTGAQAAAMGYAAENSSGNNSAGVSTLGAMYALAAGYYNSDIYKESDSYDENYTPNFSEFGSFMSAMGNDPESFQAYYTTMGEKDIKAYLDFMSYLSTGDIDMESSKAFDDQYGYIAEALGFSN